MSPQEQEFARAFILPERHARYLELLAHPRQRQKILQRLYHHLDVILSQVTKIPGGQHFAEAVETMLHGRGAGAQCSLISPARELDQQTMPLRQALERLIMDDRVGVALCVSGKLAYYKVEDGGYVPERNNAG